MSPRSAHISALLPAFLGRLNASCDPLRVRLRALLIDTSRNGVTTLRFCGVGALTGEDDVNLLQSAAGDSPPLRLRGSVDASLALAASLRAGLGNDMFRVDTATRWIDGASAEPAELAGAIGALRSRGWRVTLHTDSSEAIDLALEAFSTAANGGTPLSVADGLELRLPLSAEASARLRCLGLSTGVLIKEAVGPSNATVGFARTIGTPVSASLDRMVGGPAPLRTLAAAAGPAGLGPRKGDLLASITSDAAMRCSAGAITGALEAGKYADFVFLDNDPRNIAAADFGRLRCVGTWISGREICA